jgi:hypothetical protein
MFFWGSNRVATKEKGVNLFTANPLILMVGQGRIELPTLGFSVPILQELQVLESASDFRISL